MTQPRGKRDGAATQPPTHDDRHGFQEIGRRIKTARQIAGFTQRTLAVKLSVSASAVAQWETGNAPATARLPALAAALNVSLDWLLLRSADVQTSTMLNKPPEQDLKLLQEARQLGVDLHHVVADARQQRWIEENRGALADANAFLARHGLWSDGKRQF